MAILKFLNENNEWEELNVVQDGITFIPTVSEDGTLSWSNNGSLQNPDPVMLDSNSVVIRDTKEEFPVDGNINLLYLERKNNEFYRWDATTRKYIKITAGGGSEIKISQEDGNILEMKDDGLYSEASIRFIPIIIDGTEFEGDISEEESAFLINHPEKTKIKIMTSNGEGFDFFNTGDLVSIEYDFEEECDVFIFQSNIYLDEQSYTKLYIQLYPDKQKWSLNNPSMMEKDYIRLPNVGSATDSYSIPVFKYDEALEEDTITWISINDIAEQFNFLKPPTDSPEESTIPICVPLQDGTVKVMWTSVENLFSAFMPDTNREIYMSSLRDLTEEELKLIKDNPDTVITLYLYHDHWESYHLEKTYYPYYIFETSYKIDGRNNNDHYKDVLLFSMDDGKLAERNKDTEETYYYYENHFYAPANKGTNGQVLTYVDEEKGAQWADLPNCYGTKVFNHVVLGSGWNGYAYAFVPMINADTKTIEIVNCEVFDGEDEVNVTSKTYLPDEDKTDMGFAIGLSDDTLVGKTMKLTVLVS